MNALIRISRDRPDLAKETSSLVLPESDMVNKGVNCPSTLNAQAREL
jgi:hypothetical protein